MAEEAALTITHQRGREQILDAAVPGLVEVQSIHIAVAPTIPTSVVGQVEF